jgi:hypothetical protein
MADKPVAATLRDVDRGAKSEADVANSKQTALRTPGHETHRRPVTRADPLHLLAPAECWCALPGPFGKEAERNRHS